MGAQLSLVGDSHPPRPAFKVEDIPDLTGKVIIVTGANTGGSLLHFGPTTIDELSAGIGKETAKVSKAPFQRQPTR